ncbi:MAG: HMA2 domain-containing protein [Halothiobacillaceae bacterium]
MTQYLHHVPGRLRIRAKVFRFDSSARHRALHALRTMEGIHTVRLNAKAGSVTVCYDTDETSPQRIIDLLNRCECMKQPAEIAAIGKEPARVKPKRHSSGKSFDITREVGRIAFNVVVSRGVTASLGMLLGPRI